MSLLQIVSEIIRHAGPVLLLVCLVRILLWKRYAEKTYYKKKPVLSLDILEKIAQQKDRPMPRFSILIPAKEEQAVIEKTIEHFVSLNYFKDLYEIIIITDDKELRCSKGTPTQMLVERKIKEISASCDPVVVKHVSVPYDFDGHLHGLCVGKEVKSAKGRALNYGLQFVHKDARIIGIYDADTRPESDTLLYAALEMAFNGDKIKIIHGPKIQTSNFSKLHPFCKVVSLTRSMIHEWYFPAVMMKRLPFVVGTHLFITHELLEKLGGFPPFALTEDLEFGVHAYLKENEWTYFLPCISVEQTPASVKGCFKQALRWALGTLHVIALIWKQRKQYSFFKNMRLLFYLLLEGPVKNIGLNLFIFYFLWSSVFRKLGFSSHHTIEPKTFLLVLSVLPFGMILYLFLKYMKYFDFDEKAPKKFSNGFVGLSTVLFAPVILFVGLPVLVALILAVSGIELSWVKTTKTEG